MPGAMTALVSFSLWRLPDRSFVMHVDGLPFEPVTTETKGAAKNNRFNSIYDCRSVVNVFASGVIPYARITSGSTLA